MERPTFARFGADADGCANLSERLCMGSQGPALLCEAQLSSAQAANAVCGPQQYCIQRGTPLLLGANEAEHGAVRGSKRS